MKDTSDEMRTIYRSMLMQRSGAERMIMGSRMFDAARTMVIASLPSGLSPREIRIALLERLYGNDFSPEVLRNIREALD